MSELGELSADELRRAYATTNEEVCQTLGKALGYPWFKDDPTNFPDATEAAGVCVGDHVAESLADEAARQIATLEARALAAEAQVERMRGALERIARLEGTFGEERVAQGEHQGRRWAHMTGVFANKIALTALQETNQ